MAPGPLATRLIAGGAIWLAAILLFANALQLPAPTERAGSWSVTQKRTAHHALIVDVVARQVHDAVPIAAEIVGPVRHRYDEVLVYVRGPGDRGQPAVRRVQWTRGAGFRELVIVD